MFGYIYKTTILSTNKIYIGKHKASCFEGFDYIGSGNFIRNLKTHCKLYNILIETVVSVELIDTAETLDELNTKEKYYIKLFNSNDPNVGYNFTCGGDGGSTTQNKIKINNGEVEQFICNNEDIPDGFEVGTLQKGENHPCYDRHFAWITNGITECQIDINSSIPDGFHAGRLQVDDTKRAEISRKISEHHHTFRENFSSETLKKYSQLWQGDNNPNRKNPKFKDKNPFWGKSHSESSLNKIKENCSKKYKCPYCDYISNKSAVSKHINRNHIQLIESASTIERDDWKKYPID